MSDWENIRNSSFPNINNFLFKKELLRKKDYTNRFNKARAEDCKNIGFKKGCENWSHKNRKGIYKKLHERKGLAWTGGEWVKWDEQEMRKTNDVFRQISDSEFIYASNLNVETNTAYNFVFEKFDGHKEFGTWEI